jgi:hypothetical protein
MPILNAREEFERALAREFTAAGKQALKRLYALMGDPPDPANVPAKFWRELDKDMRDRFEPVLKDIYMASVKTFANEMPFASVDWNLANAQAAQWAKAYSFKLVKQIDATTQAKLQDIFDGFFREKGTTVGDLRKLVAAEVKDLEVRMKDGTTRLLTSAERAKLIATTEVTRAATQAEVDQAKALAKDGIEMIAIWDTQRDNKVCEICRPRDGKKQGDGWTAPPPAHPGCYCALRWVPKTMYDMGLVA